jgi:UDP-N-acetylmuramoyl-tripeptide--D-alanyl-D-alanine ligase
MKPLTLEEVVAATEGTCDRSTVPGSITRVTTDSRDVKPGDLFFAIKGDRFDGHLFVWEAFASGAMAAIVRHDFQWSSPLMETAAAAKIPPDAILIRVDDTIGALGRLGRYCRLRVLEAVTVVAVTGSNGKTTTKSMIAHILSGRWKGRANSENRSRRVSWEFIDGPGCGPAAALARWKERERTTAGPVRPTAHGIAGTSAGQGAGCAGRTIPGGRGSSGNPPA